MDTQWISRPIWVSVIFKSETSEWTLPPTEEVTHTCKIADLLFLSKGFSVGIFLPWVHSHLPNLTYFDNMRLEILWVSNFFLGNQINGGLYHPEILLSKIFTIDNSAMLIWKWIFLPWGNISEMNIPKQLWD